MSGSVVKAGQSIGQNLGPVAEAAIVGVARRLKSELDRTSAHTCDSTAHDTRVLTWEASWRPRRSGSLTRHRLDIDPHDDGSVV